MERAERSVLENSAWREGLGRVKGSIAQIARGKMRRAHELVYAINFEKGRLLGC